MQRFRQGWDADSQTLSRVDRENRKGRKSRGQLVALKGADGVKGLVWGLGQWSQAQKLSTKTRLMISPNRSHHQPIRLRLVHLGFLILRGFSDLLTVL